MEKLTLRTLTGGDLFDIIKIVRLLDVNLDDFGKVVGSEVDSTDVEAVTNRGKALAKFVFETVLDKAPVIQGPVNTFLAKLTGTSQSEIESLPLYEYFELFGEFFSKPELSDFLNFSSSSPSTTDSK